MDIPIIKDDGRKTRETIALNPNWVIEDKLSNDAVEFTRIFGKYLADLEYNDKWKKVGAGRNALTTSQLRNFFGEIRRIQMKGFHRHTSDFYMLKPKLAYATARVLKDKRNNRIKDFSEVLTILINKVVETEKPAHFQNFVKFLEATVAYHKQFGGQ